MTLRVFADTFGSARLDGSVDSAIEAAIAVQSVVDALRDHKTGQRYQVGFSTKTIAATSFGIRRIVVNPTPILDKRLTVAQACTIMTGLVLHEIGHTAVTKPIEQSIIRKYGMRGQFGHDPLAHELINIGDDNRLERYMEARYPVATGCFPSTAWWVALHTGMLGKVIDYRTMTKVSERMSLVLFATRYPFAARWSDDADTLTERAWWEEWTRQYESLPTDNVRKLFRLIDEGLARLRADLPVRQQDPEPEPPVIDGDDSDDGDDLDQPGGDTDGDDSDDGDDDATTDPGPGGDGNDDDEQADGDGDETDDATDGDDGEPDDDARTNPGPGGDDDDDADDSAGSDDDDGSGPYGDDADDDADSDEDGDDDLAGCGGIDTGDDDESDDDGETGVSTGSATDGDTDQQGDDDGPTSGGHQDTEGDLSDDTGTTHGDRVIDDSRDPNAMPKQQDKVNEEAAGDNPANPWDLRQRLEQRIEETRRIARVDTDGYGTARIIVEEVG